MSGYMSDINNLFQIIVSYFWMTCPYTVLKMKPRYRALWLILRAVFEPPWINHLPTVSPQSDLF